LHLLDGSVLRYGDVGGQGGASEHPQVDLRYDVLDRAESCGNSPCRLDLRLMPLAVTKGQGIGGEAIDSGDGEGGRGVQSSAQEHYRPPSGLSHATTSRCSTVETAQQAALQFLPCRLHGICGQVKSCAARLPMPRSTLCLD